MAISFKGAKNFKRHNGFSDAAVIKTPLPSNIYTYELMHCGVRLSPLVQPDNHVLAGQKIADLESFNALPLHSSISGRVLSVSENEICIESDMLFEKAPPQKTDKSPASLTTRERLWVMREAGVCECSADTAAHVLLTPKKSPDCVIVRCFDSDPYVSAQQAITRLNVDKILNGLDIAMSILNVKSAVVAVEEDTKKTFSAFKLSLRYNQGVSLIKLKARYPQSDSDILIKTVTGRDAQCANALVISAETLYNISRVFEDGYPVTDKIVTVSGDDILEPANFRVPAGLPISALLSDAGYTDAKTVISGGIVKGAVTEPDTPVTLCTSSVIAFNDTKNIPKYRKELV